MINKPKMSWISKVVIIIDIWFFMFLIYNGSQAEQFGFIVFGMVSLLPTVLICYLYFKDLYAFYDEFEQRYHMSFDKYIHQKDNVVETKKETNITTNTDYVLGRKLNVSEIIDRSHEMKEVYISAVGNWGKYNSYTRQFEYIDTETNTKKTIDFAEAFINGIYDHEV